MAEYGAGNGGAYGDDSEGRKRGAHAGLLSDCGVLRHAGLRGYICGD